MKKTNIHKLVFAAVLVALAVVGSLISFPIGASKCAPVQHLVNIIGAVFLGPAWAVGVGFTAALLRNLLGLGSLLAFPGSMVGAFVAGMLYKYIKKLLPLMSASFFGTSVLGGLLCIPCCKISRWRTSRSNNSLYPAFLCKLCRRYSSCYRYRYSS